MTELKFLALGALIATSVDVAHAEGKFSLGVGVGIVKHSYKDYDTDVYPVPVVNYEGGNSWFHGSSGGYYPWNDAADRLSITAHWSSLYSKAKDSGDYQMYHPDGRKSITMVGLSYAHFTQHGCLRTILAGDILDNSNSIVWGMIWLYRYTNGGLIVTPGIDVQQSNENQNECYYDASHKGFTRNGLRGYNPDNNRSPYPESSTSYNFLGNWSVYGVTHHTRLSDGVADNPMVDKSWTGLISTGITYKL